MFKVKCVKDMTVSGKVVYKKDNIYCVKKNKVGLFKSEYEVRSNLGVGVFDKKELNRNFKVMKESEGKDTLCSNCNCEKSRAHCRQEDCCNECYDDDCDRYDCNRRCDNC